MSRIGKQPITVPAGVSVEISAKSITVKGAKGELSQPVFKGFTIEQTDDQLIVKPAKEQDAGGKFYGLLRTLLNNMIVGVSEGFNKELEIQGVGYRASMQGTNLVLNLGFSHPITITPPTGVELNVTNNTKITVSGYDKQKVGLIAAEIRALKKPEPYKGKGIRYVGEHVRRKAGKTAAKGAA